MRLQLALNVKDLEEAIAFYSKLFNTEVSKRKTGYANFSIEEPPLKLVLFEDPVDALRRDGGEGGLVKTIDLQSPIGADVGLEHGDEAQLAGGELEMLVDQARKGGVDSVSFSIPGTTASARTPLCGSLRGKRASRDSLRPSSLCSLGRCRNRGRPDPRSVTSFTYVAVGHQ